MYNFGIIKQLFKDKFALWGNFDCIWLYNNVTHIALNVKRLTCWQYSPFSISIPIL